MKLIQLNGAAYDCFSNKTISKYSQSIHTATHRSMKRVKYTAINKFCVT